jgi:hypothetical protein
MVRNWASLLVGRNGADLSDKEVSRAVNVFLGLDNKVQVRHVAGARTVFRVTVDEDTGDEYGEIVFSADIYPGAGVVDPNSKLSLDAAAAHELSHYYRWKDKTEIDEDALEHIDEALTSLHAILRYDRHLNETDVRTLVSDAIQRINLFVEGRKEKPE